MNKLKLFFESNLPFYILACILIFLLLPQNSFASKNISKKDLNNGRFVIERFETSNDFFNRDFKAIDGGSYKISMDNVYAGPRVESMNNSQIGSKLTAEEVNVKITSESGDYEKEFHLLNHDHIYEEVVIHPTYNDYGSVYNVCTECDAIKFIQTTEKLVNVKASIINGLADSTISWSSAGNVDGYELWESKDGKTYSFFTKTSSTTQKVSASSTAYYYKVRHYIVEDDGTYIYGNFSNVVTSKKTSTITLKVNTKKVNGYNYSLKTYNSVQLTWSSVSDASYYVIYKSSYSNKKYSKYCTVKGITKANVTGLGSDRNYYFKVRAYNSAGKYIESKYLKVYVLSKTDGYFYNKCVWNNTWDNILITTDKASTAIMNRHTVNGYKPYVKYNYSTKYNTLYIHNYMTFEGASVNSKFEYYKYKKGRWCKSSTSNTTYKNVVLSGIKKYWQRTVSGDKYDFASGVKFKVVIVNHAGTLPDDQLVMKIKIGTKQTRDYWFYTTGDSKGNGGMFLATQKQLYSNGPNDLWHPEKDMDSYRSVAAHEYGHNLGLADAYAMTVNGKKILRTYENSESGYYVKKKHVSLMRGTRKAQAVDNDIEMVLQAQAEGNGYIEKTQYFRTHYTPTNIGYIKNTKSVVIRK